MENKISEEDRLTIELAKSNKKIAELNSEKAMIQKDLADSYFRNLILEIYLKYGLNNNYSIDPDGNIINNLQSKGINEQAEVK